MMKILLTGSGGMVGKNILAHQYSKKHQILHPNSTELNLLDLDSVEKFYKKNQPDMVIHAAGIVGGIQANIAQPVKFLVENMQMGLNVLMAAKSAGIQRFINLGSSCMYPRGAKNPLSESLILKGELEPTNEGYALAKVTSTRLCEYISREDHQFLYKTVIPCNLYGRYDKFDPKHSHMIPGVIQKIHEATVNNDQQITVWGDGLARREFMFADDFADFIYYAIEQFEDMPQNLNVGLGHDFTINEYYEKIAKVIGYKGSFEHDLSKPIGMKQKLIDDTLLQKFGWGCKTSLLDGLDKTYEYYKEHVS